MKGCWAEATVRKIAVSLAKASKQAAKIVDSVGWQNIRAKVEGVYYYIEKTFNENPKLFYIAIGVVGGTAAALLVIPAVLGVTGFSGIRPVASLIAAGLQSAGWAGAAFSTVQSAAMGSYRLLAITGIFTAVGAAVGGAVGATTSTSGGAYLKLKAYKDLDMSLDIFGDALNDSRTPLLRAHVISLAYQTKSRKEGAPLWINISIVHTKGRAAVAKELFLQVYLENGGS